MIAFIAVYAIGAFVTAALVSRLGTGNDPEADIFVGLAALMWPVTASIVIPLLFLSAIGAGARAVSQKF